MTKLRILEEKAKIGWKPTEIARNLNSTGLYKVLPCTVSRFLIRMETRGHIGRAEGSGRKPNISPYILSLIETKMEADDETTAYQIRQMLKEQGFYFEIRTIQRWRRKLGWRFCGSKYCQSIRIPNVQARYVWAEAISAEMNKGYEFEDVIFTDESKIQLNRHSRKSHRRLGCKIKLKGRHKHPTSVFVWAGISKKGPTDIVIFDGIMATKYFLRECIGKGLLPSARKLYPIGSWKLMQDNGNFKSFFSVFKRYLGTGLTSSVFSTDPKHSSARANRYYQRKRIAWWKTPAESPDINPIENLWAELKWYLRTKVKPMTKNQLVAGIKEFWKAVGKEKCRKYINHLRKVIPAVIEQKGLPTGY